jgi:predicted phosphodiesterase
LPKLHKGDIFISGHTHVQKLEITGGGVIVCNPGSVSLPKDASPAGFAVYEGGSIALYDTAGTKLKQLQLP